jgi:hypothetical protein
VAALASTEVLQAVVDGLCPGNYEKNHFCNPENHPEQRLKKILSIALVSALFSRSFAGLLIRGVGNRNPVLILCWLIWVGISIIIGVTINIYLMIVIGTAQTILTGTAMIIANGIFVYFCIVVDSYRRKMTEEQELGIYWDKETKLWKAT